MKNTNKNTGQQGELLAQEFITKHQYKIVIVNYRTPFGELDIVAWDKKELVAIEVKTRRSNLYGNPKDAVNNLKLKHLAQSLEYFQITHKINNVPSRIDVVEVTLDQEEPRLNLIKGIDRSI